MAAGTSLLRIAAVITSALGNLCAASIPVINNSFEDLGGPFFSCGGSCLYSVAAPPGWSVSGVGGQFLNTIFYSYVPDGVAYAYTTGGLRQTVGETVKAGVTYTLSVDMGQDTRWTGQPIGTAALLVNGIEYPVIGFVGPAGTWATFTVEYTGSVADAGKPITIELLKSNAPSYGFFDNVTLSSSSSVPEPSYTWLIAGGALLAAASRPKRSFSSRRLIDLGIPPGTPRCRQHDLR